MSESPIPPESPSAAEPADDCEPPEFTPAYPRPRHDGWTPERQVAFIEALAESACVTDACRAVGMSERSAYALRARADAISFRNAWETALDYGVRRLSDAVVARAIHGVAVPVFYRGEQIGEKRQFNERLAMFVLRYRDPLRYGKWLDRRETRGHPESQAIELLEAKSAVRLDAALPAEAIPEIWSQRLRRIVDRLLRRERLERSEELSAR
ncbi:MAG TPA: hypothetical protein VI168_08835 [Croceibacterium sp.]